MDRDKELSKFDVLLYINISTFNDIGMGLMKMTSYIHWRIMKSKYNVNAYLFDKIHIQTGAIPTRMHARDQVPVNNPQQQKNNGQSMKTNTRQLANLYDMQGKYN